MMRPRFLRPWEWIGQVTCRAEDMPHHIERFLVESVPPRYKQVKHNPAEPVWEPPDEDVICTEFWGR